MIDAHEKVLMKQTGLEASDFVQVYIACNLLLFMENVVSNIVVCWPIKSRRA